MSMNHKPHRSKRLLRGLILIVTLISIFILIRACTLSQILRLGAISLRTALSDGMAELQLTLEKPVLSLPDHIASVRIEPSEKETKNLALSVCGEVILSTESTENPTTDWFFVASNRDSIILTGAINCAIWEFLDTNDKLTTITDEHTFSDMTSVDSSKYSYSSCKIPYGTVKARVTFRNDEPYQANDSDILIYYGKILQGYTDQSDTLALPDLSMNQAIVWEDGKWTLWENNQVIQQLDLKDLSFSAGDILKMEGDTGGLVTVTYYKEGYEKRDKEGYEGERSLEKFEAEPLQEGHKSVSSQEQSPSLAAEYGIRHSLDSGISVCERLGNAQRAHFDFMVDDEWQGDGVNDFDHFYPWSEMRLCNISVHDGMSEIIYEDNPRFSLDGSSGNVMVEIPKFYVKRNVADGYEEVWISGVCHEGYELEPIFLRYGKELEHVYISAYLGSVSDEETSTAQSGTNATATDSDSDVTEYTTATDSDPDVTEYTTATDSDPDATEYTTVADSDPVATRSRLVSVSGAYPEIRIPYSTLLKMAKNNGAGFSDITFLMYQAIQKLFLVETGSLDSSSLIAGHAKGYFYHPAEDDDPSKVCLALESATQTNSIKLSNKYISRKIAVGNSVILLDKKNGWDSYDDGGTTRCRDVIRIDKSIFGGVLTLTLDGEPFDVVKGETVVSCYPTRTGRTDELSYATSVYHSNNGMYDFKYRGIENIYGTSLTLLNSDAYIMGGHLYYHDGNRQLQKISEPVPIQNTTLNASEQGFAQGNINCIRRMSFDTDHPTVMVPVECGASSYNYYGDYWLHRPRSNDAYYYLAVGGVYDNERLCGIFQMRGLFSSKIRFKGNFHVGRIMYREQS